jgi:HEAT repeat protein
VDPVITLTNSAGRLRLWLTFFLMSVFAGIAPAANRDEAQGPVSLIELREDAIRLVRESARERDPFLRANAIEAMQSLPDRALPLAQLGLEDEHPAVRFTALVTIGKMRLRELGPAALRLLDDPDDSVRAAAMFAAKRCGQDVDISEMGQMLASPNPSIRSNVVMLLGMMGDPSALPMIQSRAMVPMPSRRVDELRQTIVRVQFAEAQVLLGDDEAISPLRAAVFSRYGEVRVLAVTMLGRLRDASIEASLMGMIERKDIPIELKLAAAEALSHIGGRATIKQVLGNSAFITHAGGSDNPVIRSQAAIAAGALQSARARVYRQLLPSDPPHIWRLFEDTGYLRLLEALQQDPHPQVRLSAAAAVLRALGEDTRRVKNRGNHRGDIGGENRGSSPAGAVGSAG